MKPVSIITTFLLGCAASSSMAATVSFGGPATQDVDNWTTNSQPFVQGGTTGYSANWENVVQNSASIDSANNEFDLTFEASTNYTIGHIFIHNQSFDLSGTTGGVETLTMTADFNASSFANWSPVITVASGGTTTFYRWNHSGNSWNGNGPLNFSDPFPAGGDLFDLSQNGNGTGAGAGNTVIWGSLNNTAGNFGATRNNGDNPNLQATSGTLQFGFIQWGASTGGNVSPAADFTTAIESFEVEIGFTAIPEPSSSLFLLLGGLAVLRRRR